MTDDELEKVPREGGDSASDRPSDPMGGLLKSALSDVPVPERSLLPGIQERIRIRTRGRYYRDRWRAARDPTALVLMVALLIAIMIAAGFLVFAPLVSAPKKGGDPASDGSDRPARQLSGEGQTLQSEEK